MTPRPVRYVLSTHWDREWYQPFQVYRHRLVQLLDQVLADLRSGALAGPFTCDGQAIILDDYLEVRPEHDAQVRQLLASGGLLAGPWYVMPDEFLVAGESLIRNLRHGRARVRALGGTPSAVGFLCDTFGHISQMPQILRGFGIRGACIWRGLNQPDTAFLLWRGADGTELPVFKFWRAGYCDYAFEARLARDAEWRFDAERTRAAIEKYLVDLEQRCAGGPLVLFDGGDHQAPQMAHYALLRDWMRERAADYDFRHVSLDDCFAQCTPACHASGHVAHGELRKPGTRPLDRDEQWLIPGVLSSRVWIKQANAACENLLLQWAEPLTTLTDVLLGQQTPPGYLTTAWQWLMQNHPHDSICGCSIDQVHEDMRYRFSQARQIGERLREQAQLQLATAQGPVEPDALRVTLFNPLPHERQQVETLWLDIPAEWPTFAEFFGFEDKPAFRIFGPTGEELPYQRLAQQPAELRFDILPTRFTLNRKVYPVQVAVPLGLPPCGWSTLTVRPAAKHEPTRHPGRGLLVGERRLRNEFLEVEIQPDGTLDVHDLRTGTRFTRWLAFEDAADIGDGWYHGPAVNGITCLGPQGTAKIEVLHDGPQLTALRITVRLSLPRAFDFQRMRRAPETIEQTIASTITLRAGAPWLEVETTLANQASDHRLRVLFPSGAEGATHLTSDGAFDVLERPIALPADNHTYRELAVETQPQQSWSAVGDATRALAVIAPGLYEVAVPDRPERPLALTLLRATGRTVMTTGEPGGQMLGQPLTFRYQLRPLAGGIDRLALCRAAQQFAAGLGAAQLTAQVPRPEEARPEEPRPVEPSIPLPAQASLCHVTGDAVVTSLRQVEGATELRLFNPLATAGTARLDWAPAHKVAGWTARLVDFESQPLGAPVALGGQPLELPIGARQILTLRVASSAQPA